MTKEFFIQRKEFLEDLRTNEISRLKVHWSIDKQYFKYVKHINTYTKEINAIDHVLKLF